MVTPVPSLRERFESLDLPGTVWFGAKPVDPLQRLSTGIPVLDDLLGGGVPRGWLSEVVGSPSSGRTAVVGALLAAATGAGVMVGVVDLPDALDPASLHSAGIDLERVLWARPREVEVALKCAEVLLTTGGLAVVVLDLDVPLPVSGSDRVWPRLARAARGGGAALVVLAGRPLAGSFAALRLGLSRRGVCWSRLPWRVFDGLDARVVVGRDRFGVPGRSTRVRLGG